MWHCRADCGSSVSLCHMRHDTSCISLWDDISTPHLSYIIKWDFHIAHQLSVFFMRCAGLSEEGQRSADGWECRVSVNMREREQETRGDFGCDVYEMLTSQRWVDVERCCPRGIEIYLSQVTPIGSKPPRLSSLSFPHARTLMSASYTHPYLHTYLQQQTCTTHRLALRHVCTPGVAVPSAVCVTSP